MAKMNDLKPDKKNANRGTQRGMRMLDDSLRKFGAGRSILIDKNGQVIAGNKTLERAADIGMSDDIIVVQTDGTKLVAVQRTDLDLDSEDGRARALAIYDNRVGELDLSWDPAVINELIEGIADADVKIMLGNIAIQVDSEDGKSAADKIDDVYSQNIHPLSYTPKGDKPELSALVSCDRQEALVREIDSADIPDDEKAFLRLAAQRHNVFDYRAIAEYYCHATQDMQSLMEDSALVIIDFGKAIELGYVKLSREIIDMYLCENR